MQMGCSKRTSRTGKTWSVRDIWIEWQSMKLQRPNWEKYRAVQCGALGGTHRLMQLKGNRFAALTRLGSNKFRACGEPFCGNSRKAQPDQCAGQFSACLHRQEESYGGPRQIPRPTVHKLIRSRSRSRSRKPCTHNHVSPMPVPLTPDHAHSARTHTPFAHLLSSHLTVGLPG